MDKLKALFIFLFCIVAPGIALGLSFTIFKSFVLPWIAIPLNQILEQPVLELICLVFGVLSMPALGTIALVSFVIGLGVLFG